MKPTQKLELRQSQSLVMTAQLQQSIKLLQLSSLELNDFVEQELERNPLLAREEGDSSAQTPDTSASAEPAVPDNRVEADSSPEILDSNYGDGWQHDEGIERPAPEFAVGRYDYLPSSRGGRFDDDDRGLEQTLSSEITLRDHLIEQLQMDIQDPQMRLIGRQLIDLLDDAGYLRDSLDELARTIGAEKELVEHTVKVMQRFDPAGIFARNLTECLRLQLQDRNKLDPMMASFLDNIHLMEKGDLKGLQSACGATEEDFSDMLREVRLLDPYPGRRFAHDMAQPVIPDVFVRQGKDGIWQVELNHDVLPKVLLDRVYCERLDEKAHGRDEKKYISEQLAQANWLIRSIDQRAQTILKVSSEIVRQQEHFLLYGIQFLKPLTLKDIALQVDLHESTISRVTTNKFMATPRGIFELKYFFTSSISSSSGADEVSSKTVMYYIKELIETEKPDDILSDDTIVTLLKNRNIDIARRTVAKYREAMNIPSSVMRRRLKKTN